MNDPDEMIRLLDAIGEKPYYFISEEVNRVWQTIQSPTEFRVLQKAVMLKLIADFDRRAGRYVDSVVRYFERSFSRIQRNLDDPAYTGYDSPGDPLLKDLGLCRQRLFPAGAQVVEIYGGFARSLMFRGGLRQFIRFAGVLMNGHTNYYQYHTHKEELEEFNPAGFDQFYLTVADMLKANPSVRGLYTGTWFLDPALKEVSPHLAYIRERPAANGASFFFSDVSVDTGALAKSRTRQRLYQEGKYLPKRYCMVWPRKAMIEWAERFRA